MPPEWAPQDAVWMLWPYRTDNWRDAALPAQLAYATVAAAILPATPVLVGVPEEFMDEARRVMPQGVTLVPMASDDAWIRDSGPSMVTDAAGIRHGVAWIFNAYGGLKGGLYNPWDRDAQVASLVCAHHHFAHYAAPLVLEGGSIHTDGEGTLLVTEEVLLNPDRNPGDAKGRAFKIHKMQQPGPLHISATEAAGIRTALGMNRAAGTRLAASYVNFLITNKRVVMPMLDTATDAAALSAMQAIFPEHDVIGVPAREILLGGGNIHCITQQIPAAHA